jgi:hypothetical protein
MGIKDISLGDFSAENDSNLSQYFVEEIVAYQAAEDIKDTRYVLIGRTGSGKSAILSHISSKFKDDRNYIVASIRPTASYLDAIVKTEDFAKLRQVEGLEPIFYKLIWHYLIMIAVLRSKYGTHGPIKKGRLLIGNDLQAYKFLNRAKQLTTDHITFLDIAIRLIKDISLSIGQLKITTNTTGNLPYEITRDLFQEVETFHEKGFWDVVGGSKLYLLFDDLDLGWNPNDENQQSLLIGLFSIMKEYNYRERVKPLIALRTNILEGLNLPQREKFENNILRISWSKEQLRRMLLLRLKEYGGVNNGDGFEQMFKIGQGEDPISYMIEKTLYRPRDLLAFCKYAITDASKTGVEKIEMKNVLAAESLYSKSRSQALADEWKYLYPKLDLLIRLLVAIAKQSNAIQSINTTTLREILVEAKERILTNPEPSEPYDSLKWVNSYFPENNSPTEIVSVLYKLGILGYKNGLENYIFSHEQNEILNITNETEFMFHPMLHNISITDISLGEENPWI